MARKILKLRAFEKTILKQKSLSWTKIGSGVIAVATAGSAFLYCSNLNLEREEIKQEIYSIADLFTLSPTHLRLLCPRFIL